MTIDEAIKHAKEVAEENEKSLRGWKECINRGTAGWSDSDKEQVDTSITRCSKCAAEHRQLAEWLKDYKRLKEQEPCEDEYIKVPKKALKYRTAGMVAYNVEWLKNHFDIERAVICGALQPYADAISKQAVLDKILKFSVTDGRSVSVTGLWTEVNELPPVTPQEPCEDAISRQAVLDLIEHYNSDGLGSVFYGYEEGVKFADKVKKLPPITSQEPCDDTISRQAAIDACGCLNKEHLKSMAKGNVTHSMTGTRLYGCYKGMMSRCYRKKDIHYKAYGGRGIIVCDEWKNNAKAFIDWALSHGYSNDLTIERVNVNGNYEPSNCTWIPTSEQYKNKQSNCHKLPKPYEPQESEEAWQQRPEPQGSAYDKCPICIHRNESCQFGSLDCHFEERIDM